VLEKSMATFGTMCVMQVISQAYIYPPVAETVRMKEAGMSLEERAKQMPWIVSDMLFPLLLEQLLSWYVIWVSHHEADMSRRSVRLTQYRSAYSTCWQNLHALRTAASMATGGIVCRGISMQEIGTDQFTTSCFDTSTTRPSRPSTCPRARQHS
jgi:hypothetical protein